MENIGKYSQKWKKIKQQENKYGEKSESENDEERVHFCIVSWMFMLSLSEEWGTSPLKGGHEDFVPVGSSESQIDVTFHLSRGR